MSWDDVNDIIFSGTPEQISGIRCPECEGVLILSYFPATRSVEIQCQDCGAIIKQHGVSQTPNFALASA